MECGLRARAGMWSGVVCALLAVASAASALAETTPPPHDGEVEAELASYLFDPPLLEPVAPYAIQEVEIYAKQQKQGMLQQIYHATTVLQADENQISETEIDLSLTLGFPLPTRESPLLVTPAFGLDIMQVGDLDLPPSFYDATVDFRYLRPWGDCWMFDFALQPGVYGNTETDESIFRVQGRAVAIYQWSPTLKALLGGTYLDRDDVEFLPIAGVIWTPSDDWKLELLFPRPRVAMRSYRDCCSAWWLYLGGELGGGAWGVTRTGGEADVATVTDVRFMVGMEREHDVLSGSIEAGYVFARELQYQSGVGNTEHDGAAMFRVVLFH